MIFPHKKPSSELGVPPFLGLSTVMGVPKKHHPASLGWPPWLWKAQSVVIRYFHSRSRSPPRLGTPNSFTRRRALEDLAIFFFAAFWMTTFINIDGRLWDLEFYTVSYFFEYVLKKRCEWFLDVCGSGHFTNGVFTKGTRPSRVLTTHGDRPMLFPARHGRTPNSWMDGFLEWENPNLIAGMMTRGSPMTKRKASSLKPTDHIPFYPSQS